MVIDVVARALMTSVSYWDDVLAQRATLGFLTFCSGFNAIGAILKNMEIILLSRLTVSERQLTIKLNLKLFWFLLSDTRKKINSNIGDSDQINLLQRLPEH